MLLIICFIGFMIVYPTSTPTAKPVLQPLVAHAGGAIYGFAYTNSLEALNQAYQNGFRLIELDFEWTKDEVPVLIHDWSPMVKRLFMDHPTVYTHTQFKTQKTFQNLTLLDTQDLQKWLSAHKDAFIVTDIKNENIKMLQWIKEHHPSMVPQLIPQIYSFAEHQEASDLGYEHMILTLYRLNVSDQEVVDFARTSPLFAITMPIDRGQSPLPKRLLEVNTPTFVHTVNSLTTYETLQEYGVYGIYTDHFQPTHWVSQ